MSAPCAECGRISAASPSDYFCSDTCQQRWYAKQTFGYPQEGAETPVPSHLASVAQRWRAA
jgi:endogenous inhibitor of DNA gyrase (YacG/DUF329 family)